MSLGFIAVNTAEFNNHGSFNKQHVCLTGPVARGQCMSSAQAGFDESTPFPCSFLP